MSQTTQITDVLEQSQIIYNFLVDNGGEENLENLIEAIDFSHSFLEERNLHGFAESYTLSDVIENATHVINYKFS